MLRGKDLPRSGVRICVGGWMRRVRDVSAVSYADNGARRNGNGDESLEGKGHWEEHQRVRLKRSTVQRQQSLDEFPTNSRRVRCWSR